jgi:response regulator RpfG family c-di-GMP phosphodiesterase
MYEGMLLILGHLVSRGTDTQKRARQLAWLATAIGREAGLSMDRLVDIQSAALLQEIGTMEISREVLAKAGRLTASERDVLPEKASTAARTQREGLHSLERVIPIMLAANNDVDYYAASKSGATLESRVMAIANEYNNLISDAENRSALSPHVARSIILRAAGTRYSFDVVNAFVAAFDSGSLTWTGRDLPSANDSAHESYERKFGKPGAEEETSIRRSLTLA